MSSRPRLITQMCLAAAVAPLVGGCLAGNGAHRPTDVATTTIEPPAERSVDRPAAVESSPAVESTAGQQAVGEDAGSIEALRRKSEAYAQALEILLRERGAAPPAEGKSGSAVEWLDANRFQVTLGDPPRRPEPPTVKAVPKQQERVAKVEPATDQASLPPPSAKEPVTEAPAQPAATEENSNTPLALADAAETLPTIAMITPAPLNSDIAAGADSEVSARGPVDAGALLARLSRRVKENPKDVASHLEYQMLLFLMDEQVPELASIATLPQEDRELVTALLDGISNLRATLRRDANLLIAEKIRPVVELSDRLRTSAELTIPTMTLCSRVDDFGRYEVMEPRFIAGRESATIVYCELENFSSQYEDGQWQTALSMELSLFSEAGQQVYVETPAAITDTCRSRRRDFFLRKLIKLPSNLIIGRYVLKVTIVDTQGNRVAESSLPLQIVAQ